MRDIKFRAWDNGKKYNDSYNERMSKSFSLGDTIVIFDGDLIPIEFLKDIDRSNENKSRFELMQYTGLKDRNGVEIYEGDIIKEHFGAEVKVEFIKGCFVVDLLYEKPIELASLIMADFGNKVEVIGNIYETPELLEEEKK